MTFKPARVEPLDSLVNKLNSFKKGFDRTAQTVRGLEKLVSMKHTDVNTFKSLGNSPYEQFYEKVVRVQVRGDIKSITGRVIAISDRHITLQHLDQRTTLIRIADISVITIVNEKVI